MKKPPSFLAQRMSSSSKMIIKNHHLDPERAPSDYWIGLGMHNISGFSNWTKEEFSKHVIMEVEEIILHDEWGKGSFLRFFDFALLILKTPVRFSLYISPVCLPKKEEIDILESGENIVIGFGTSKIWYIEYNKLLGGKLQPASLIPPDLLFNKSALITEFTEGNLEKNIIDGYFRTFTDLFPGIEICVKNYDFLLAELIKFRTQGKQSFLTQKFIFDLETQFAGKYY